MESLLSVMPMEFNFLIVKVKFINNIDKGGLITEFGSILKMNEITKVLQRV